MSHKTDLDTFRSVVYEAYDSTHRTFSRKNESDTDRIRRQLHYYARLLPPAKEARILEIGCGDGDFLLASQLAGYKNLRGVDASPSMSAKCLERGLDVVCSSAFEFLENDESTWDAVYLFDVLEHLTRPEAYDLVVLIRQRLADSGYLVVQVPNATSILFGLTLYGDLTHEMAYTPSSISQLLRVAGYSSIRVSEISPRVYGLPTLLRWLCWIFFRFFLKVCTFVATGNSTNGIFSQNLIVSAKSGKSRPRGE